MSNNKTDEITINDISSKDLWGIAEIAKKANVTTSAVFNWKKRFEGDFPEPVSNIASGPVYNRSQIENWLKRKQKITGAIIISIINVKGGVGKTTTTVGLAQALSSEFGKKVLLIDLDPQTNATAMLIGSDEWHERNKEGLTLATLFGDAAKQENKFILNDVLIKNVSGAVDTNNLHVIPSSMDLVEVQDMFMQIPLGKYYVGNPVEIINKALSPILDDYDYVLIDCPPNLGIITLNGLRISRGYIVPTTPDFLSLYAIPHIDEKVKAFANGINEIIEPLGIVFTRYKRPYNIDLSINKLNRNDVKIFKTIFPESIDIAGISEHIPDAESIRKQWGHSRKLEIFMDFAQEIMDRFS